MTEVEDEFRQLVKDMLEDGYTRDSEAIRSLAQLKLALVEYYAFDSQLAKAS